MKKTWIAVLAGALLVWGAAGRASDKTSPYPTVKTVSFGLRPLKGATDDPPPEKSAPELIPPPSPAPDGPAAASPKGTAPPATTGAPAGCGTCGAAPSCVACGPSCWGRLKAWACYHSTTCGLCGETHCGQRWVPLYLFFLSPCREGYGVACGSGCGTPYGPAPCKPACAPAPAPTCKAPAPVPPATQPVSYKATGDKPSGLVTKPSGLVTPPTKAKGECGGTGGPVCDPASASGFFGSVGQKLFGSPTGQGGSGR
jgi:hypothetical protein